MAHYKGASSEGGRAMLLQKKRETAKEELELQKKKIEDELKLGSIDNKFAAHYDAIEAQLKSSTVGLVTLNEMKAKQEDVVKEREQQLARRTEQKILKDIEDKREFEEKKKRQIKTLSFTFDENDDEEADDDEITSDSIGENYASEKPERDTLKSVPDNCEGTIEEDVDIPVAKKVKIQMTKNPDVDTSFLPDRVREEEENQLRETLRKEWKQKQEKLKNEEIEIVFSYWDGSGHRRSVTMKKGASIYQFLFKVTELLRKEFYELKTVTADQLMYVKEDLIIPHHYTFYDFIVTKARGKSGPLFSFDVHDDVRLMGDATVEKDESHAGKVLMRMWYERNKHIFPASRWEPYDPTKNYDKYTISDKK